MLKKTLLSWGVDHGEEPEKTHALKLQMTKMSVKSAPYRPYTKLEFKGLMMSRNLRVRWLPHIERIGTGKPVGMADCT